MCSLIGTKTCRAIALQGMYVRIVHPTYIPKLQHTHTHTHKGDTSSSRCMCVGGMPYLVFLMHIACDVVHGAW